MRTPIRPRSFREDAADGATFKVIVETILPLSDATRGQELSERGHLRGKIVLRVA